MQRKTKKSQSLKYDSSCLEATSATMASVASSSSWPPRQFSASGASPASSSGLMSGGEVRAFGDPPRAWEFSSCPFGGGVDAVARSLGRGCSSLQIAHNQVGYPPVSISCWVHRVRSPQRLTKLIFSRQHRRRVKYLHFDIIAEAKILEV